MTTTFLPFSRLPLELRDQVWQDALPDDSGPTLYFYRDRGYWWPFLLPEDHHGYRPGEDDMGLAFHTDLLDQDNQFQVPLVSVNREARNVALKWLDMQGIEARPQADGTFQFVRPFDPQRDALYITPENWELCCLEPSDRVFEPDIVGKPVEPYSPIQKFAVSEATFLDSEVISWIPEMEQWFTCLATVFVVMDPQPDGVRGPWRWEVQGNQGWWLSWNKENEEFDFHEGSGGVGDRDLRRRMEEAATKGLRDELVKCGLDQMEVRPVYAVRR